MINEKRIDIKCFEHLLPEQDPELRLTIKKYPIKETDSKLIPVCEPFLMGNEKKYLNDCLESNWISSAGKYINLFEEAFANKFKAKYAITCSNGTTALHLALKVFDIKEGDEVIVPTFTMIATANAVKYVGATPVFIDCEFGTWNINVERIEGKINYKTKAIIPVHIYGHPCEMEKIHFLAKKYNLIVIEDAAEAHGAEYNGKLIGSLSDATCFSFYANKIMTTGEGGMITTNNKEFYEKACILRDHAFSSERHFWHKYQGFNFRMTNMQAAIGLAQLENLELLVQNRINNAIIYKEELKEIDQLILPDEKINCKSVYWMFAIIVKENSIINKDKLRYILAENGIETRSFFIPLHLQPMYYDEHNSESFEISEFACKNGLYLPSSSGLTNSEIKFICKIIKNAFLKN